jgi:hypothetical protein
MGIVFESKSGARENDRLLGGYSFFFDFPIFALPRAENKKI